MRLGDLLRPALAITLAACSQTPSSPTSFPDSLLRTIPDPSLARLSRRVIYFGHQSVGANLVQGLQDLAAQDRRVALPLLPLDATVPGNGGLLQGSIGTNGNPASKIHQFVSDLSRPDRQRVSIAMMKLCYLDFKPGTDPEAVFAAYAEGIARLRLARPELAIAHITVPLTAREPGWKRLAKRLTGRSTADHLNALRERYNARLREAYGGRDPLFDLAALESERAAGGYLRPAYTDDGGHLNEHGRREMAARFLAWLTGFVE